MYVLVLVQTQRFNGGQRINVCALRAVPDMRGNTPKISSSELDAGEAFQPQPQPSLL